MRPMCLYDLQIRGFGVFARCRVATTQTNDDAYPEEVQTDEVGYNLAPLRLFMDSNRSWCEIALIAST